MLHQQRGGLRAPLKMMKPLGRESEEENRKVRTADKLLKLSEMEARHNSWSHITYRPLAHPTDRPTPGQHPEPPKLPETQAEATVASEKKPDRGRPPKF